MKVLLLGGNGMLGRNILEHPEAKCFDITAPSKAELNLCDYGKIPDYLERLKPEIIVNAAGKVGGIEANIREPVKFFLENLDIGRNVVWGAKEANIKLLLNLGSSCMYPRNVQNPLSEDMILAGELEPTNEGYALAKIAAARLCKYINHEDHKYKFKTIIPCNLYGRWDNFNPETAHLIPSIVHKIHHSQKTGKKRVSLWGDGTARREFMYARDLADFILYALKNFDRLPELMNVGMGCDYSVEEYYQTVAEVIGYSGDFVYDISKPVGMKKKLVDISALKKFGWQAKTKLIDGIRETYGFYLEREGQAN